MANQQLHFVVFPFLAQGHIIPMVDTAILLAQRGGSVSIITTPVNALRFQSTISHAVEAGLDIRVVQLYLPTKEVGLPEGYENFDMVSTHDHLIAPFFAAINMLRQPFESFLGDAKPSPSCIISDSSLPWTDDVAHKFHIPRLVFYTSSCIFALSVCNICKSNVLDQVASETEPFVVPGLLDKVEINTSKLLRLISPHSSTSLFALKAFGEQLMGCNKAASGIVVNTFDGLEAEYIKKYAEINGKKVWCVGPVQLCNKDASNQFERGSEASIDKHDCLNWLAAQDPSSVLYVCLGSMARISTSHLIEVGLGLEESNRPFIWSIRFVTEEFNKWNIEEKFEERIKGRGLLIRGWAPQVMILSHKATGGFLTHCGWNSTLEGICAGIPLLTWPFLADQFLAEALVVEILRIGVKVHNGEEDNNKVGVFVKREDIKICADKLMNGEDGEARERRDRAKELGDMAKKAMEVGGSSYLNMNLLIEEIMGQANV